MLVFSMTGPKPKISVVIMDFGNNAEDSYDENSSDNNSDEDLESEEEAISYILAQRVHLKNHEKYRLFQLLS